MAAAVERLVRARHLVTLDDEAGERGPVDALALIGEWIVAAGPADELTDRFPEAERVDFGSAVVVPGFNDAHQHLSMTAGDLLHLDLSAGEVTCIGDIKAKVAARAASLPPGTWIRGSRFDDTKLSERRPPTRAELDEVAPHHPVLLSHISAHVGVANSPALAAAGIHEGCEPPPGGTYGHDAAGQLDGRLVEQAMFNFAYPAMTRERTVLPPAGIDERLEGLRQATTMFHAAGITSVGDAMVGPAELALYQEARRRGLLTVRVNMLVTHHHFDRCEALGLRSGFGDHRLRFGGVKTFVDGAVSGRTCLVAEPFEGSSDHGLQIVDREELRDIVRSVHEAGSRLAVHANGDRAIELLLEELEDAAAAHPRPDARHRVEHCSIVTDDIVRRLSRLGAVAVPFGSYVAFHGAKLRAWYGDPRLERMFAHRTLLDGGVRLAGSSDYPCGPYEPLHALQSCVTRRADDGGDVLGPSQRISPREALELYTTGAAYAAGEEHLKGRLAPGYLADFVVLGDDPLNVDPDAIASVPVLATWVGGDEVWRAESSGDRMTPTEVTR